MESPVVDLVIDLEAEYDPAESLTLAEAAELVAGRWGAATISSIRKWCRVGFRPLGKGGPILFFPARRLSGTYRTMRSWVKQFEIARFELAQRGRITAPLERSRKVRDREFQAAEKELDRRGVKIMPMPGAAQEG